MSQLMKNIILIKDSKNVQIHEISTKNKYLMMKMTMEQLVIQNMIFIIIMNLKNLKKYFKTQCHQCPKMIPLKH